MAFGPFAKGFPTSLADLQEEVNRVFDRMWHTGLSTPPLDGQKWAPPVDLLDEPAQYVLTAEVPGLNVEDIELSFDEGELILRGHKPVAQSSEEEVNYLKHERRFGSFCRRVPLPERVQEDAITARCTKGVLEVVLPKREQTQRRSVRIDVVD
jgi:HSP20 family protein